MDTTGTPGEYRTVLRGANMRPREDREALDIAVIPGLRDFKLERDRYNPYDMFAVKVLFVEKVDGDQGDVQDGAEHFVGFIHRDTALEVGQWMDAGWSFSCEVIAIDTDSKKREHQLLLKPLEKGPAFADTMSVGGRIPPNKTPNMDDDIPF